MDKELVEVIDERGYKEGSAISQIGKVDGTIEKRKHISVTTKCNSNCIFCFSEGGVKRNRNLKEIRKDLENGIREGCTYLVLSGGEPTIHPDFLKIVKLGKGMGYRNIKTITNGRMFSYENFLNRAVKYGVSKIAFSIHGHNAELHDALTSVPGSFKQSLTGLRNALDTNVDIQLNIVLSKANLSQFKHILDFFINLGVRKIEILNLAPEENAWRNREKLFFNIDDYKNELNEIFENLEKKNIEFELNRFNISHFPKFIKKENYELKKFNELSIRDADFSQCARTKKPLKCFSEKCDYCFIKNECIHIQNLLLNTNKSEKFDYRRIKKVDNDFRDFICINHARETEVESSSGKKDVKEILKGLRNNILNENINIDLISLGKNKNLAKLEYLKKEDVEKIIKLCGSRNYAYFIKKVNSVYCHIYISKDKKFLEAVREYENKVNRQSEIKLALLLGYPLCCVNKFLDHKHKDEKHIIKEFFKENNGKRASSYINRFSDFILIGHMPHSINCKASLEIAKKNLGLLERANIDTEKIKELNKRIILLIKDFFVFLDGYRERDYFNYKQAWGEFNDFSMLRVFVPKSDEEIAKQDYLHREVIDKMNLGNRIKIFDNKLTIFNNKTKLFTFLFTEKINHIVFE